MGRQALLCVNESTQVNPYFQCLHSKNQKWGAPICEEIGCPYIWGNGGAPIYGEMGVPLYVGKWGTPICGEMGYVYLENGL